jgi:hypothetical protein
MPVYQMVPVMTAPAPAPANPGLPPQSGAGSGAKQ